jgi:hypothetical protein
LDVQTGPRGDVPSLGLTDEDVGLPKGVDCDILAQGLIGLIEYSYHQSIPSFLEAVVALVEMMSSEFICLFWLR